MSSPQPQIDRASASASATASANVTSVSSSTSVSAPAPAALTGVTEPISPAAAPKPFKLHSEYPEYQAWVASGGLDKFAKDNGLEPDFLTYSHKLPVDIMVKYGIELGEVPGLQDHIDADRKAWGPQSSALQTLLYARGAGEFDYSDDEASSEPEDEEASEKQASERGDGPGRVEILEGNNLFCVRHARFPSVTTHFLHI